MITSSELRVGNWVRYGSGLVENMLTLQVKTIGEDGINHKTTYEHPDDFGGKEDVYGSTDKYEFEYLNGIELTPEILEKAGFEQRYEYLRISLDGVVDEIYFKNEIVFLGINSDEFEQETNVKYLHQLQNLYFALTGQELEIIL